MEEYVLDILRLGAVGIVSGFFAAFMAGRRHRNQNWWAIRVSAYRELIENLARMAQFYRYYAHSIHENVSMPPELRKKMQKRWGDAKEAVDRSALTGNFLFSKSVIASLDQFSNYFEQRPNSAEDLLKRIEGDSSATDACLRNVVAAARKDLRISRWAI